MKLIPLGLVLGASTLTLTALHHVDQAALNDRPEINLTRSAFCDTLLAQPGWSRADGDLRLVAALPPVAGRAAARSFVGARSAVDAQTEALLHEAEARVEWRYRVVGDVKIRELLARLPQTPAPFTLGRGSVIEGLARFQIYRDYQAGRFATELPHFERLLVDWSEGRRLGEIAFAVSPWSSPEHLFPFMYRAVGDRFSSSREKRGYLWHLLSYDAEKKVPVWRMGWSQL